MRLTSALLAAGFLALFLCAIAQPNSAPLARIESHRSPIDVAVLPDGRRAITANFGADSASLVDLELGTVLAEVVCGRKPAGVAISPDGKRAAVSNSWSNTVSLFNVVESGLQPVSAVATGDQPRSLVFAAEGASIFVGLAGAGEIAQIAWPSGHVLRKLAAPSGPHRLVLSHDGKFLAAASGRSCQVRCWNVQTGALLWERTIHDAFNLHGLTFSPDDKELVATHIHDRHRSNGQTNIAEGWALDNRLTRLTLQPDPRTDYWQIALDTRGKAVGDPCAAAISADNAWLTVAAGGTHELLIFQNSAIPWNGGDPGDLLDSVLGLEDGKLRRLPLGGRPVAVQFIGQTNMAVVANYLLDAVQIVDVKAGKLVRQAQLGGPLRPDLIRQGEIIFYDARRSHHEWFSCHSCHPDGHTSGRTFDTLNDDSYGNPKLTPTLRGVAHTGPWTWHGWQKNLSSAVEKSLTDTLFGPKPAAEDVRAVTAFLGTLEHPPNPNRGPDGSLSEAAQRGKTLFKGKGGCAQCHRGDYFTSAGTYDVKIEPDSSPYDQWNPPSLRGLYDRGPYLHDGRAETLDDVLRVDHAPQKLGNAELTPAERNDLIEFLKSI